MRLFFAIPAKFRGKINLANEIISFLTQLTYNMIFIKPLNDGIQLVIAPLLLFQLTLGLFLLGAL